MAAQVPAMVVALVRHRGTIVLAAAVRSRGPYHTQTLLETVALDVNRVTVDFVCDASIVAHGVSDRRVVPASVVVVECSISVIDTSLLHDGS